MTDDRAATTVTRAEHILVCGPNWLGDSIMCMPALQMLKQARPDIRLTMLVRPSLAGLWRRHAAVDTIIELEKGVAGTWRTVRRLRRAGLDAAYVFPNSFRAAVLPWLALVPCRTGMRGHRPRFLLTRVVTAPGAADRRHQVWEYLAVVGLTEAVALPAPRLAIDADEGDALCARFGLRGHGPIVGLIPGAAYGPAKRWPAESFVRAGRLLIERLGGTAAVFGTADEADLCARVATGVGPRAVDLAGQTGLDEVVALLSRCTIVIANDSGGMHLAAAVGCTVTAVFGITDPLKTGPLGERCRVVLQEGARRSRDLRRSSPEARRVLCSITPERVAAEALALIASTSSAAGPS